MGNTNKKQSREGLSDPVTATTRHSTDAAAGQVPAAPVSGAGQSTAGKDQEGDAFKPLGTNHGGVTFDERKHMPHTGGMIKLQMAGDFTTLKRGVTFDTRGKETQNIHNVLELMYRRHFNALERRDTELSQMSRISEVSQADIEKGAVVVVDPFSTGMCVAQRAMDLGHPVVALWSDTLLTIKHLIDHVPQDLLDAFSATIFHDGSEDAQEHAFDDTIKKIEELHYNVIAVMAGAESGVILADRVSEHLNLIGNGTEGSDARRNKYDMGEKVRRAGVRAVKQCEATKWEEVQDFFENELKPGAMGEEYRVIVKPVDSAGSDDVTLCKSLEDVQNAFGNIQGKINCLGLENKSTLVQEFLSGTEYVVDTVSYNGEHKVVALWEYDKRPVNGAAFVYYGVHIRPVNTEKYEEITDYIFSVLDALDIMNGPGHAEVKFDKGSPCLIEVGSRCHGGGGAVLKVAKQALGYEQCEVAVSSYLDQELFHEIPVKPRELKKYGGEYMFVSYQEGTLRGFPGLQEIREMPSFFKERMHLHEGDEIKKTVDLFTTPGSVMMVHEDEELLKANYDRIHELCHEGLYDVDATIVKKQKDWVIVVDPFSTGAWVAQAFQEKGYEIVCIYSEKLENMDNVANLVPAGVTLDFAATIAHESTLPNLVSKIKKAANTHGASIKVCVPGAETGVLLADELCEAMNFRTNDFEHSIGRRDKYVMGETLRNAGLRAVMQKRATTWAEAEEFIKTLPQDPLEVVLKPLNSAGSDDVILCYTLEEAKEAFELIIGKINGLGLQNNAVLVQEFLSGTEYVVDTMSRDGEHKVIHVWEYDKRQVNGAPFVYFGVRSLAVQGHIQEIVDYQLKVLDALGFKNGPGHGEVKYCRGSPILIEVGARCHGGEGNFLAIADRCQGYNQVYETVSAYVDPEKFKALPKYPTELKAHGIEVMLVNYKDGTLKSMPGIEEVRNMPSYLNEELYVKVGDAMKTTIDCFTTPGSFTLVHEDFEQLEKDRSRIHELSKNNELFEIV